MQSSRRLTISIDFAGDKLRYCSHRRGGVLFHCLLRKGLSELPHQMGKALEEQDTWIFHSLKKPSKPTGCWKYKGIWLTASPDVAGQKFCIKHILQISFYDSVWYTFRDAFAKRFLHGVRYVRAK